VFKQYDLHACAFRYQILSVTCGSRHSAVIDDDHHLITFGSNKHGQLGTGDIKKHSLPHVVEGPLLDKTVTMVACGDDFTVAATSDKTLYSWGLGDNGQLGAPVPAGRKTVSLPRPVFESSYSVQELSCRHWHTIIIGEHINEDSTSHGSTLNGENLFVTQKEPDSNRQFQADSSSCTTSRPAWLQEEWTATLAGQCSGRLSQSRPELPTVSTNPSVVNCAGRMKLLLYRSMKLVQKNPYQ
jgi:alpha-tubulin suppressor-like RCC1 family protein